MDWTEFIVKLESMTFNDLLKWTNDFLYELDPVPICPLQDIDYDIKFKKIYEESVDRNFKNEIKNILCFLIEDMSNPDYPKPYIYNILSVLITIKPAQGKERIRKLLYAGYFRSMEYDSSDLFGMLILLNTQYDVDQQFKNYLFNSLPYEDNYCEYFLICYNGLINSLILPFDLIIFYLRDQKKLESRFLKIFKYSIAKLGLDSFINSYFRIRSKLSDKPLLQFNLLVFETYNMDESILENSSQFQDNSFSKLLLNLHIDLKCALTENAIRIILELKDKNEKSDQDMSKLFDRYIDVTGNKFWIMDHNIHFTSNKQPSLFTSTDEKEIILSPDEFNYLLTIESITYVDSANMIGNES